MGTIVYDGLWARLDGKNPAGRRAADDQRDPRFAHSATAETRVFKYAYAVEGVTYNQAQQVKLREGRVTTLTRRLMGVLRWEPLLGVGVIVCVGLMNVFAGTLTPIAAPTQPTTTKPAAAFNATVKTTDNKFT